MAECNPVETLYNAIDNYYQYNPDTLMPLLMLALSVKGELSISTSSEKPFYAASTLVPSEIQDYDWVMLDAQLKEKVAKWIKDGVGYVCVKMNISSSLLHTYETFRQHDEVTVVQEYHHRIGRLVDHQNDGGSAKAQCQYATFILAEALLTVPVSDLNCSYLELFNHILVNSGLQPKRDRITVAKVLGALLNYDGKGLVYNPFAGCSIAGAMLGTGARYYGDGDKNDKIFAASCLLHYGMGVSNRNFKQRNSTKWLSGETIHYVLSTYVGYVNGQSAFDFCLGRLLEDKSFGGKYAGMVRPREIFEKQTPNWFEALRRDWVSTIVLLPFGEVALLIDAQKDELHKSRVSFYDFTNPMNGSDYVQEIKECKGKVLLLSDVCQKDYLRRLVVPEIKESKGYEVVRLSDYVSKIERSTYLLSHFKKEERVMAYLDRKQPYNRFMSGRMSGISKMARNQIFSPCYHLTGDSLIVNKAGRLEPRLFSCEKGSAFFENGYAFVIKDPQNRKALNWLFGELNSRYVHRQLHPYGMDEMVPETITEEQILNLKLYKSSGIRNVRQEEKQVADKLPDGYELSEDFSVYTIHRLLGRGSFGYAYSAECKDLVCGEVRKVVLKEFYRMDYFRREGNEMKVVLQKGVPLNMDNERKKFRDEAEIMRKLGNIPDSHIVPVEELFESRQTETLYYVMPYYRNGSLRGQQLSDRLFTEDILLNKVVVPLCKALHYAHKEGVLHLDIKPDNILIDDNGDAILIDFGVARQYDERGCIIDRRGSRSSSCFAAPEVRKVKPDSVMVEFGSEPDIFGLAATLYNLATRKEPYPIRYKSGEEVDLRSSMEEHDMSKQFIDAVIAGLKASAESRPHSAQEYLNLFPGCEDIVLP